MVSNSRHNARGYDVRMEIHGFTDSIAVGLEDKLPLRSVEPGVTFPAGVPHDFFMDRFTEAYRAELLAFTEVVAAPARRRARSRTHWRRAGSPRRAHCRCTSTVPSPSKRYGRHERVRSTAAAHRILGAARITERALVAPARSGGHRLVAVAARDRSRAEAFAAAHGVERTHGSYAELLADPEVEVVYNPLANGLHGPWNLAALAAGKHVLTEKPSASNSVEAREVLEAAAASGTVFMEAFHYLFHPVTRRLHELLASGELGELRRAEALVAIPAPLPTTHAGRCPWRAAR